jgi:hypothetical protein
LSHGYGIQIIKLVCEYIILKNEAAAVKLISVINAFHKEGTVLPN